MITLGNIKEVVESVSEKDKKRIANTNKAYIVLKLHCFNAGSIVEVILTNNDNRYKNVSYNGDCLLEIDDAIFNNIRFN